MIIKAFSERLKELRLMNDLTQQQVADRLTISRTAVGKWETETAYPDVDKLKTLAEIYNCSVDYLLGLSDNIRILTRNEIAALKNIMAIAAKENIIASEDALTDGEYKNLAAEIEMAHMALMLYKRITEQKQEPR